MQDQKPKAPPHQESLRRGRFSQTNARYFVTFCIKPNTPLLTNDETHPAFRETVISMAEDGTISNVSYCLMPDHAHIFFRLGESLSLSRAIARLKSKTKQLAKSERPIWQSGYYDHKLRTDGEAHAILHYIYMNPYEAKLATPNNQWPYTEIAPEDWSWFQPLLKADCPYPEWLTDSFATKVAPTP